ncbi:MAG: hypothetical protein IIY81_05470, partial [Lachnospiraceae bacterium]|nr:hypothetical protein [Lachnospiraceae bacterium]
FNLGVRGEGFSVLFNGIRPGLCSYVCGGRELMKQMPVPNFWRAPTDNDRVKWCRVFHDLGIWGESMRNCSRCFLCR